MTRRIVLISTAIMTTLLALVVLWQFRIVVLYVLISLVLAATVRPISNGETRRSLKTRFLLILQYVVVLVVTVMLIFIIGKMLTGDFQQLADRLSSLSTWTVPAWLRGTFFEETVLASIPTPDKLLNAITGHRELVVPAVLGITQSVGGAVSGFFIIIFLSAYWSVNQNHFERLWLSLLPGEVRKNARFIWRTVEHDLGAYTRSEFIQSLLAGILLGVGYYLLGSPFPTLLAVTGAITWLVPLVGGILAIILPFFLGLLTGLPLALVSVLYTIVILGAMQVWVEPRLFKLKSDNPILTFVILLALADAFGLLGIIAAPPISVICQTLWSMLVANRLPSTTAAAQVSDLQEQHEKLQRSIHDMEGIAPPLVMSSMERLDGLLEKAQPILKKYLPPESTKVFEPVEQAKDQGTRSKKEH